MCPKTRASQRRAVKGEREHGADCGEWEETWHRGRACGGVHESWNSIFMSVQPLINPFAQHS